MGIPASVGAWGEGAKILSKALAVKSTNAGSGMKDSAPRKTMYGAEIKLLMAG